MTPSFSANLNQFLTDLKRFNDAGVINTLGVIATFAVAFIALAPTIWKWKKRPKLAIQLKQPTIKNVPGDQRPTVVSVVGQPIPPEITTTAGVLIHNTGASAALSVRCVITDLYAGSGKSFQWRDHPQETLNTDSDLPAGLPLSISLIGRTQIGDADSGFRFGKTPAVARVTASTIIAKPKITFVGDRTHLPAGTYVVRIVVSANNAAPTTHLIRIELTNGMQLQFANWRERRAIRKADRQAMKGHISKG
jgi:hypothetical protein